MAENQIVVAALYQFVALPHFKAFREALLKVCADANIKGTLLLAHEGINGTIAGTRPGIDQVLSYLRAQPEFAALEWKESYADVNPFYRLKVRLKKEIVTIGLPEVDPTQVVGTYVEPEAWNDLIADPEVVVLDTRNDYEVEIGTFKRAINPQTETFREFPQFVKQHLDPHKHKKVAMFCTGGIRCEKASSYMKQAGFDNVYHLKGGILKYLETVPPEQSLWDGECFVFDGRVGVKHGLDVGDYEQCFACRYPITKADMASPHYQPGVQCPKCYDKTTTEQKKRFLDRQVQVKIAKQRGQAHIGGQGDA
jgi:UPF0176 protein